MEKNIIALVRFRQLYDSDLVIPFHLRHKLVHALIMSITCIVLKYTLALLCLVLIKTSVPLNNAMHYLYTQKI